MSISIVSKAHLTCTACELSRTRIQVVPGVGRRDARMMIILEAPGREEDEQGIPAIGIAGRRLDQLLLDVGVKREEVFITNCVHCRPPDNLLQDHPHALYTCPP